MRNFISFAYGDNIKWSPVGAGDQFWDSSTSGEIACVFNSGDRIVVVKSSGQVQEFVYQTTDGYSIFGQDNDGVSLYDIKFIGRIE